MNYHQTLGLLLYALGFAVEVLAIVVTKNVLVGLIGAPIAYIGWRIRWAE